jgi:hypothetical protein
MAIGITFLYVSFYYKTVLTRAGLGTAFRRPFFGDYWGTHWTIAKFHISVSNKLFDFVKTPFPNIFKIKNPKYSRIFQKILQFLSPTQRKKKIFKKNFYFGKNFNICENNIINVELAMVPPPHTLPR